MQLLAIRLSVALATFLFGITLTSLLTLPRFDTPSSSEAEQEVLKVEQEDIRAYTEPDLTPLKRVLADDFSFGRLITKTRRLSLLASPGYEVYSLSTYNVHVRVYGDDAWVSGKATMSGRYNDREFFSPPYSFTRRYVKRQGRWQVNSLSVALLR